MPSKRPLTRRYGFGARPRRQALLELIGLGARDHGLARRLQKLVIAPRLDAIMDEFYRGLRRNPAARAIFQRGFSMAHLRDTQRRYLLTLGIGFDRPEYFESRLQVGVAHMRVPVPLSLYQASYGLLQRIILRHLPSGAGHKDNPRGALAEFLVKIASLDMALAIETYHAERVDALEHSLRQWRGESARWQKLADTDRATGLVNRAGLMTVLRRELDKLGRKPMSVILTDVDGFKSINDRHGHLMGDKLLRGITARLLAAARKNDVVGRYGGDEFLLVLKETPLDVAQGVAERLRARVDDEPLDLDGRTVHATLSLGVTEARPEDGVETLIGRADAALYRAKHSGRNRVATVWERTGSVVPLRRRTRDAN